MGDHIQVLPEQIANKIAAGEVIQRPSSAVKELLENAVDAGATQIQLILQDAGKSLIQVIDNGKGMNASDALLCFARHATSKINELEDLFSIRTMGFRGEALASIAAVAQVELRTKRQEDTTGTLVEIQNSAVVRQEPTAMNTGTSLAMKNLFFNIPARRNFLKSNPVEIRHSIDEFVRIALSFPQLQFSLHSNGEEIYHLEPGNLKQRVLQIWGNSYGSKLVSVDEKTDYLLIRGYIGKPEAAKKTRGEQFFFVNNRFIKSPYLHHAVMQAFQQLLPAESHPFYVLFIDLDPAQIDINVHPTKQEIKFEDEKIVYAFVQAAVKHALAQFSITPTLEFDLDPGIQQLQAVTQPFTSDQQEAIRQKEIFRNFTHQNQAHFLGSPSESNLAPLPQLSSTARPEERFDSLIDQLQQQLPNNNSAAPQAPIIFPSLKDAGLAALQGFTQLHNGYIVCSTSRVVLLIHQQYAHERILYEQYRAALSGQPMAMQKSLFPVTLTFSAADATLLSELIPDLQAAGYFVEPLGKTSFVITGVPADMESGNEKSNVEMILENYKKFPSPLSLPKREKLIRSLTKQHAIQMGKSLSPEEMKVLVGNLFNCELPGSTVTGCKTFVELSYPYLEKLFA